MHRLPGRCFTNIIMISDHDRTDCTVRIREFDDDVYAHCMVVDYHIDVKKALAEHPDFEERIIDTP